MTPETGQEPTRAQTDPVQTLVYGISHDMGAPLRAVVQLSSLLSKRIKPTLEEKESYWLELIEQNGLQAQRMLESLLSFSRLSTHRSPDTSFSLQSVLDSVLSNLQKNIESNKANVACEGDFPEIYGCIDHWHQLLFQLSHNALLYHPKDSAHTPDIRISCETGPSNLTLSVSDNGLGVPNNFRHQLGHLFRRFHVHEEIPGMGIGLALCDRIAQLNNGQLSFEHPEQGGLRVCYKQTVH